MCFPHKLLCICNHHFSNLVSQNGTNSMLHLACLVLTPGAVVGLERTFYQASEDVGVVEVCAIVHSPDITCPIEFAFNINLLTTDGSAGIYFSCTCE